MKRVFTSLAPNLEADDVRLAAGLLFRPWRWRAGTAPAELERWFTEFTGASTAAAFASGRGSLYALLKALNLPAGSEVLLQAYTCVAVPGPVLWAGLEPVYVDCDESLTMSPADLKKRITPRSKVLIIQHTFGQPADMEGLLTVARARGLFVIEDCAHALGGSAGGKRLGSMGDAAFFSFGRDKVLSAVFGGVVTVRDKVIGERLMAQAKETATPSGGWVLQQLMHPIILLISKALYDVFALGRVVLELAKRLKVISKAVYPVERRGGKVERLCGRMPNAVALLALHQLGKLERFNAHRREITDLYTAAFRDSRFGIQRRTGDGVCLRYGIFHADAHRIVRRARGERIELGDWYTVPVAPAGVDPAAAKYTLGSCPVAERLSRQTFNLPTHIGISAKKAQRVVEVVKRCVSHGS